MTLRKQLHRVMIYHMVQNFDEWEKFDENNFDKIHNIITPTFINGYLEYRSYCLRYRRVKQRGRL